MKRIKGFTIAFITLSICLGTQISADASLVSQWAISASASNSYPHGDGFAPSEMAGPPNAQGCDGPGAWAGFSFDTVETVKLNYAKPVIPRTIKVYQIAVSQAISKIEVSPNGSAWTQVYTGDPSNATDTSCNETTNYAEILTVNVTGKVSFPIKHIRMIVDQSTLGYAEIDAVQLVGVFKEAQTIGNVASSLKNGSFLSLPTKTNKNLAITWTSGTKSTCTVRAGKVKGIKKGACKLTGTNPGNSAYLPVSAMRTLAIK